MRRSLLLRRQGDLGFQRQSLLLQEPGDFGFHRPKAKDRPKVGGRRPKEPQTVVLRGCVFETFNMRYIEKYIYIYYYLRRSLLLHRHGDFGFQRQSLLPQKQGDFWVPQAEGQRPTEGRRPKAEGTPKATGQRPKEGQTKTEGQMLKAKGQGPRTDPFMSNTLQNIFRVSRLVGPWSAVWTKPKSKGRRKAKEKPKAKGQRRKGQRPDSPKAKGPKANRPKGQGPKGRRLKGTKAKGSQKTKRQRP